MQPQDQWQQPQAQQWQQPQAQPQDQWQQPQAPGNWEEENLDPEEEIRRLKDEIRRKREEEKKRRAAEKRGETWGSPQGQTNWQQPQGQADWQPAQGAEWQQTAQPSADWQQTAQPQTAAAAAANEAADQDWQAPPPEAQVAPPADDWLSTEEPWQPTDGQPVPEAPAFPDGAAAAPPELVPEEAAVPQQLEPAMTDAQAAQVAATEAAAAANEAAGQESYETEAAAAAAMTNREARKAAHEAEKLKRQEQHQAEVAEKQRVAEEARQQKEEEKRRKEEERKMRRGGGAQPDYEPAHAVDEQAAAAADDGWLSTQESWQPQDASATSSSGPPAAHSANCPEMFNITEEQLRCVFPMLDKYPGRARNHAKAASQTMGKILGNTCAWAAFLGNVAIESKELTLWKEIKCRTQPPYCGRGPLQITGSSNYAYCASQPSCNCPGINQQIESPANNDEIGFGTAACVWENLFGHSLTPLADGTRAGFIRTCCSIHQGHYPCGNTWQYGNREQYWRTATTCLGGRALGLNSAETAWSGLRKLPDNVSNATAETRPKGWGRSWADVKRVEAEQRAAVRVTKAELQALHKKEAQEEAARKAAKRESDAMRERERRAAVLERKEQKAEASTQQWAKRLVSDRLDDAADRVAKGQRPAPPLRLLARRRRQRVLAATS